MWNGVTMPLAPSDTNSSSTDPVQTTHFYAKEEKAKETRKDNDENHQLPKVKALDIVWARYSGYPKWPAIVCNDPVERRFTNSKGQIHVQFFDHIQSRAWIERRHVSPLDAGETLPSAKSNKYYRELKEGLAEAKKALRMNLKRRHNLIVNRSSVDESDSDDSKDDSDQSKEKDDNQNIDEGKSRLRKEEAKRRVREMARKILEPSEPTDDDDLITHRFSAFSSNAESSRPSRATPSSKNVKPPGKRTSKRARVTFDMSENELSFSSSSSNDDDDDDYEENKRQSKVSGGSKKSRRKSPPAATKKAAASPVKEELSEYERLRLKNIEERKRIFETLHLNDTKKRLSDAFDGVGGSHKKLTPSRRGLAAPNKKKSDPLPLRKSSRLLKLDADTSLQLPEKEPTVYPVLESDDRPPKPFRTLQLDEIIGLSKEDEDKEADEVKIASTKDTLEMLSKLSVAKDAKSSFGSDIGENLAKLSINDDTVAKVVPDRIFSMSIHPTEDKVLLAVGGKWGAVGIWDVNDVDSHSHGVSLFTPHSRPVNALDFSRYNPNHLLSTSYDGSVRILDFETQSVQLLFGNDDYYTNFHREIDANNLLVALGNSGQMGLIDRRVCAKDASECVQYFQPYERSSVKTVDVHPLKPELVLCANNKSECTLFDIRSPGKKDSIMPRVRNYTGATRSLSSAFFSQVTGRTISTVAYDNKIRLYHTDDSSAKVDEENVKPFKSINHNTQTGRWLSTFKAEWHPNRDDMFMVGSMAQPRQIDVFSGEGAPIQSLRGEALGSICSIVKCHPSIDVIAGGNSSGRVHVFM